MIPRPRRTWSVRPNGSPLSRRRLAQGGPDAARWQVRPSAPHSAAFGMIIARPASDVGSSPSGQPHFSLHGTCIVSAISRHPLRAKAGLPGWNPGSRWLNVIFDRRTRRPRRLDPGTLRAGYSIRGGGAARARLWIAVPVCATNRIASPGWKGSGVSRRPHAATAGARWRRLQAKCYRRRTLGLATRSQSADEASEKRVGQSAR